MTPPELPHNPRLRAALAAGLLALALVGCAHPPPPRPQPFPRGDHRYLGEHLSWLARREMARRGVTGLSIAVFDAERVIWAEGFGWADAARRTPATPRTIYRAGSISKLFTVTAALQLMEAGRLDLDAPLTRALPAFRVRSRFPDARPITPRSLMTHHSGLPSDVLCGMWTRDPGTPRDLLRALGDEDVASPPGTVYSYSNVGMSVLGAAIEETAGRPYGVVMRERVLGPLGMATASFAPAIARSELASKAYQRGREVEEMPLRDVPAGGLNASVLDIARFAQMVLRGGEVGGQRVLRPESVAEMLRPQNGNVPLDGGLLVGLGWALAGLGDIDIQGTGPVAHHGGATIYHRAQVIVVPRHRLGVVVMANSASATRVVNQLAVESVTLALELATGIGQPPLERVPLTGGDVPPATRAAFEGHYASAAGLMKVWRSGGGLRADMAGTTLRLVPRVDGLLGLRYRLLGIFPVRLGPLEQVGLRRATVAGREIVTASLHGRELVIAEKLTPSPIPAAWRRRLGAWEVVDAGGDLVVPRRVRLAERDGFLMVEYSVPEVAPGTQRHVLTPRNDDEAVLAGIGRGLGETVRVVRVGGQERLRASGYLLRRTGK